MDIFEIYNEAKENLKITLNKTEKEIHDGDYFNMIVEISNPKRSIFSFMEEPAYAYENLVLKVEETAYAKPRDPAFEEGYKINRTVEPNDKIVMRIPLEAKSDLPFGTPPEMFMKVKVEAHLKTDQLFGFDKTNGGDPERTIPT